MRLRYFHREIKVATSSYDSGAQPWRVGNACIGSYENRFFPPSGLVSRRYLYPPRACHSETIQSCQPVPLASVALLLRRARFDDAVGRLGLRRIGPWQMASASTKVLSRVHRQPASDSPHTEQPLRGEPQAGESLTSEQHRTFGREKGRGVRVCIEHARVMGRGCKRTSCSSSGSLNPVYSLRAVAGPPALDHCTRRRRRRRRRIPVVHAHT